MNILKFWYPRIDCKCDCKSCQAEDAKENVPFINYPDSGAVKGQGNCFNSSIYFLKKETQISFLHKSYLLISAYKVFNTVERSRVSFTRHRYSKRSFFIKLPFSRMQHCRFLFTVEVAVCVIRFKFINKISNKNE